MSRDHGHVPCRMRLCGYAGPARVFERCRNPITASGQSRILAAVGQLSVSVSPCLCLRLPASHPPPPIASPSLSRSPPIPSISPVRPSPMQQAHMPAVRPAPLLPDPGRAARAAEAPPSQHAAPLRSADRRPRGAHRAGETRRMHSRFLLQAHLGARRSLVKFLSVICCAADAADRRGLSLRG